MRTLIALLVAVFLAACGTPPLQGTVSRFHNLPPGPTSFAIVPSPDQEASLEFRSYAGLVRQQLVGRGWRESPFDSAQVAVFLQYQISQGRQVAFSYPIMGTVPTGRSTTTGTINTFGNTATVNATTTQQTTLGVVGTGVGRRTEFDRAARIVMHSIPVFKATKKLEPVFEAEIRSSGSTGDLPTVMPVLIRGLFEDFPGASGTTRRVSIPFQ